MSNLDRTGEPIEPGEHQCDNGFLDRDADPPLRPCLICRPQLSRDNRRRALLDADQLRQEPRNPEGDPDA
ncbi:hypothetical protein CU254_14805 [Amycolatopsis sp. AA4]|uniref:hypothetical protein n=1 Tax=Actinomycetes TaxID=1760 RepID=UPI0001B5501B|nr:MULTISPECIES: hypothetical protein [Actinomycetes]ATY11588.1 hypothetical protein CU254_14805 [Amycolatopsis sp. AA4]EFL07231.1 predicted protein [Streptomyces sp. AA4]